MSNGKDETGKGPLKGAPEPAIPKKPAVVIDLKATEIPIKDGKPQAPSAAASPPAATVGPGKSATTSTSSSTAPAGAQPSSQKPAGPQSTASASTTKPTEAVATPAKSNAPGATASSVASASSTANAVKGASAAAAKTASDKPMAATATPVSSAKPQGRSSFVSMLTHATAGILGGLIALLAAESVLPLIGLPPSEAAVQGKVLQARIADVESKMEAARSTTAAADPALAQKFAAAERRLADLERAGADLAFVKEAQAKLAADTQALADKLAKGGDPNAAPTDATSRLTKLEETLTLLATAAGTDQQRGRIPQLAAVTGKVSDLEVALSTGLAAVRKSVTQEIDARLGTLSEATETAKAGVLRVDRDMTQLKADANTSSKRLDDALQALKGDVETQLKSVARAQDVTGAVAPVAAKIAALETTVQTVVKSEADRKADADRVVLSLELGNLKRTIDRGAPFAAELDSVQRVSGGKLDLAALEAAKASGLPTLADLTKDFRNLAHSIIEADAIPAEAGVVDKLMAGAKSIVRIRKTEVKADDKTSEATVARMEAALKTGQLQITLDEAKKLPAKALAPAKPWLDKVAARAQVDKALMAVDEQLKSSLGSTAAGTQPAVKGVQ